MVGAPKTKSRVLIKINENDHHLGDLSFKDRVKQTFRKEHIPKVDSGRIIDIGCAYGATTVELAHIYPNCNIVGIDIREDLVYLAKVNEELGGSKHEKMKFICADGYNPPFPNNTFAVAYAMHSVYYKIDKGSLNALRGLKRMGELVEKGGHLLVCGYPQLYGVADYAVLRKSKADDSFVPVHIKCIDNAMAQKTMGRIINALR
jgi:SAM-dependent methyltransferase